MIIKGQLKEMGLVDIVQVFYLQHKTVGIYLFSEVGSGKVYMKNGKVVHSICCDLSGEDAFYQLVGWVDGEFDVVENVLPPALTVHEDVEYLIFESIRRLGDRRQDPIGMENIYTGDCESSQLIKRLVETGILEKKA